MCFSTCENGKFECVGEPCEEEPCDKKHEYEVNYPTGMDLTSAHFPQEVESKKFLLKEQSGEVSILRKYQIKNESLCLSTGIYIPLTYSSRCTR